MSKKKGADLTAIIRQLEARVSSLEKENAELKLQVSKFKTNKPITHSKSSRKAIKAAKKANRQNKKQVNIKIPKIESSKSSYTSDKSYTQDSMYKTASAYYKDRYGRDLDDELISQGIDPNDFMTFLHCRYPNAHEFFYKKGDDRDPFDIDYDPSMMLDRLNIAISDYKILKQQQQGSN